MRRCALLLLLVLVACDDDPVAPDDTTNTLAGTYVRSFETDGPAFDAPFLVELFDLDALVTIDATETDAAGRFAFSGFPDGRYLPVLHSDAFAVFGLPRGVYVFTGGEDYDDTFPLAPIPNGLSDDVEGVAAVVTDAVTGEPVVNARVEMNSLTGGTNWSQASSNWSEFRGHASEQEAVTDATGRFLIRPVPKIAVPDDQSPGGLRFVVPSVRIVAPGYRAATIPSQDVFGGVRETNVVLQPGADEAVVTGRVVDRSGAPVPGIRVHSEWRRTAGQPFRRAPSNRLLASAPGVSGPDGRFRIDGLAAGVHNVRAAVDPDDGWVGPFALDRPGNNLGGLDAVAVTDSTDVGDLIVAPAIRILSPAPGDTLRDGDVLRWTPVDGAGAYVVRILRGTDVASIGGATSADSLVLDAGDLGLDRDLLLRIEIRAAATLDAEAALSETDRPVLAPFRAAGVEPESDL